MTALTPLRITWLDCAHLLRHCVRTGHAWGGDGILFAFDRMELVR